MDNQVPFEEHLRDTTCRGKEVVYVLLITSILGRLPLVRAEDTGTIPFCYHISCCNGAHRDKLPTTTTSSALIQAKGLGRLPDVVREFLGAGLVPPPLKCMKCSV